MIIDGIDTNDPKVIAMAASFSNQNQKKATEPKEHWNSDHTINFDDPKLIELAKTITTKDASKEEANQFGESILTTLKAGLPAPLLEAAAPGALLASFKGDNSNSEEILKQAFSETYLGWKRLGEKLLDRDAESEGVRQALESTQSDFDQKFPSGHEHAQKELYKLMIGLSTFALPGGAATGGFKAATKVAELMPKGLKTATKIAGLGLAGAPTNALLSAANAQPEQDLSSAAEQGAVISVLANSAIAGAFSTPSIMLGRQATGKAKDIIKKLMSQRKGVSVLQKDEKGIPLQKEGVYAPIIGGEISGNNELLTLQENVLAPYGLGGQQGQFEKVAQNVDALAEDLFQSEIGDKTLGGYEADDLTKNLESMYEDLTKNADDAFRSVSPQNYSGDEAEKLLSIAKDNQQKVDKKVSDVYEKAQDLFSESGAPLDPSTAVKEAKQIKEKEDDYVSEHPTGRNIELEKEIQGVIDLPKNLMKKFGSKTEESSMINPETGKPFTRTIPGKIADWGAVAKNVKIHAAQLSDKAKKAPTKHERSVYRDLATALRQTIRDSADKSGNPAVLKAYKDADKYFSEVASKFSNKSIQQFFKIWSEATGQQFYSKMKSAALNDPTALSRILTLVGDDGVKQFMTKLFSEAKTPNGELDIQKLLRIFNSIGEKQKGMLMSKSSIQKFNNLQKQSGAMKYPMQLLEQGPEKLYGRMKQAVLKDPRTLSALIKLFGPGSKSIFLKKYFHDAINGDQSLSYKKLISLYNKIPDAQKKTLLSDDGIKKFEQFKQTHDLSQAALDFMTRVQTGKLNLRSMGFIGRAYLIKDLIVSAKTGQWHKTAYLAALLSAPGMLRKFMFDNPQFIRKLAHAALPKGTASLGSRSSSGAEKIESKIKSYQKYTPALVIAAAQAGGNE